MELWYPPVWLTEQLSHGGWGAFIVLAFAIKNQSLWSGIKALLYFIFFKEYVFDIIVEGDSFFWSTVDSFFFGIGGLIGGWTYWRFSKWCPWCKKVMEEPVILKFPERPEDPA